MNSGKLLEIKGRLETITEEEAGAIPEKGGWSAKQILGHLIDSAAINRLRIRSVATLKSSNFSGYNQVEKVNTNKYHTWAWMDVIQLWYRLNVSILAVIDDLDEEELERTISIFVMKKISFNPPGLFGDTSLNFLITDYWDHMNHHLNEILGAVPHKNENDVED